MLRATGVLVAWDTLTLSYSPHTHDAHPYPMHELDGDPRQISENAKKKWYFRNQRDEKSGKVIISPGFSENFCTTLPDKLVFGAFCN